MKIFIYEYFSSGGADVESPLSVEGGAILRAAMDSFAKIPGVEPFTIQGHAGEFGHALARCDGLLMVAPETGGILEAFTARVHDSGKINFGCGADAVKVTGDKLEFSRIMKAAGIPHPSTVDVGAKFDSSEHFTGAWVLKPADGAGSEGVNIYRQPRKVEPLIGPHIAQEFIEGEPMSLSIVSGNDWLEVLSVNRQRFRDEEMTYDGGEITGEEPTPVLRELAARIKEAVPGLSGYWGVDFVMTQSGPVVIEVNPRLTTSFCGLVEALRPTPAVFIMAAVNGNAQPTVTTRKPTFFTKTGETRAI